MKNTTYIVHFHNGTPVIVSAGTEAQAKILAQAKRIKAGMNYLVKKIEEAPHE